MTVKASISLTEQQEAFARRLVAEGRIRAFPPSFSTVWRCCVEKPRRTRPRSRRCANFWRGGGGPFIAAQEYRQRTDRMLAEDAARFLHEDVSGPPDDEV